VKALEALKLMARERDSGYLFNDAVCCHVVVPSHHGMARPQVADK